QRWSENSTRHDQLKQALKQLLPLKQAYPDLFSFKILGTTENFAVCDSTTALIGMQTLATETSLFPTVNLKLRTSDPAVIQPLLQRFENPTIDQDDAGSYFNRGITRYDMRNYGGAVDDFTQVINICPSAAAYNCRGVAWAEMGNIADALRDFGHAIRLDARLFAARCNRGALRTEVRDYDGAIKDLETAVEICPDSAIPYFYAGQALQAMGGLHQAIGQFGLAIERQPNLALPYCYRGTAHQKQGNLRQAIADLETAAQLLRTSGDINNLTQVMRKLNTLKQGLPVRTSVLL
ncbi:MAG: tetratricopeptide repeat protein, partial [Cyanobacteria bacterium P01_F01_bin.116]